MDVISSLYICLFQAQLKLYAYLSVERRMFTKGHRPDGPTKRARTVLTYERRCYCSTFGLVLAVALLVALVVHKINDANKAENKQKLLVALTAIEEKAEEMRLAMDQR